MCSHKTLINKVKTLNIWDPLVCNQSTNFVRSCMFQSWTRKRCTFSFVAYFPVTGGKVTIYCRHFQIFFPYKLGNCEIIFFLWWLDTFYGYSLLLVCSSCCFHTHQQMRFMLTLVKIWGVYNKKTVPRNTSNHNYKKVV